MASDRMTIVKYDAVVLGGGFYGTKIALALHNIGLSVAIVEPRALLSGATTVNQARVHCGLHYPRFFSTAYSAAKHYRRFITDHASVIVPNERHLYAIAQDSKTTPAEFERVAAEIGAPIVSVPIPDIFAPGMVDAVYEVNEVSFDINKITAMLRDQLRMAGIPVLPGVGKITSLDEQHVVVEVSYPHTQDPCSILDASYVFNCTYSNLDSVVKLRTKLKKEWVEVALCEAPSILRDTDITVMDGLYWSIMKYPPSGEHALTHVKYTPHNEWFSGERPGPQVRDSWFKRMQEDAMRFIPAMAETKYLHSLWTIRVVLAQNEEDDGRPILWEYAEGTPRVISILGSKFNSVYDAVDEIERGEWWTPSHKTGVMRRGRRALVGRGLVGSNLDALGRFTDRANSETPLAPGHYDQIVCAAPSSTKWEANREHEEDARQIELLKCMLDRCTTDEFVLISTVDAISCETAYASHRHDLEEWVKERFTKVRIVRLPALFGPGLKKNALFDLMHDKPLTMVNSQSTYQWYDLTRLWSDIQEMRNCDVTERNFVSPPLKVEWIIAVLCPTTEFPSGPLQSYDVTDPLGYIMTEREVKDALWRFVKES